ncbi:DUF1127 domain-containing protein [Roseivivax sp. GX 12232]|uniref:DUF1127 domain-containing protein n=1 Tax=Roseivivax sp. GX 12232 TaxID=2900547 RepID=UPI001E3AE2A1|nr:DUF1127 domain-containing protein [Roseivivax sp. GX 12232]MCE0504178.1 DUF1127 domain-containing protein [Roseivivax sp. GX 12232]
MAHIDRLSLPALPRPGLRRRVTAMLALARQRRQLARLDDARLADLGLSRAEAEAEAARAPWDAPDHWHG